MPDPLPYARLDDPGPEPLPPPARPVVGSPLALALTDRWAVWRDDPRARAVALLAVAAAAGLFWYQSALRAVPVSTPPTSSQAAEPRPATTSTTAGPLVVHVAGAVNAAGVYRLAPGSRVADAVAAAGGPARGAALDRLNLAARVADGQRVYVPVPGEVLPVEASGGAGSPGQETASSGPVDLNAATQAQLEALPGIGPTLAQAIVRYREAHGGFRSVRQLLEVEGIGEGRFDQIRDLVVV